MEDKKLKEMTSEELLAEIKAASEAELYGNVDEPQEEQEDVAKVNLLKDFSKFTRLIKKQKKLKDNLKLLEIENKDNELLQKYIKMLKDIDAVEESIEVAKKGYLYESAILAPDTPLENEYVKVTIVKPYNKEEFNKDEFKKDYGEDSEMYQKYFTLKSVKGSIKYKVKE